MGELGGDGKREWVKDSDMEQAYITMMHFGPWVVFIYKEKPCSSAHTV